MELLWRWCFGLGMLGLLLYAYAQLRPAIVTAAADTPALRVTDLVKQVRVLAEMLTPLMPLLLKLLGQLYLAGGVLWAAISATGRGVILRSLTASAAAECGVATASLERRWWTYFALHAARVLMLLILVIGYLGGILAAALVTQERPSVRLFMLITLTTFFAAFLLWSYVNRVLALAPVFDACDGLAPLDAIAAAVLFLRRKGTQLRAANRAGNILHVTVAVLFTLLGVVSSAVPLPPVGLAALILLETLLYCVLADYFHLNRLAMAVAMVVGERAAASEPTAPQA